MTPARLRARAARLDRVARAMGEREAGEMRESADTLREVAAFIDKLAIVTRKHWRPPSKAEALVGVEDAEGAPGPKYESDDYVSPTWRSGDW